MWDVFLFIHAFFNFTQKCFSLLHPRSITKILLFLIHSENGIVFFSDCSLLVYRNAAELCVLTGYPATWLNLIISCNS